jgi:GNAT superfamily N-acetyltransferase
MFDIARSVAEPAAEAGALLRDARPGDAGFLSWAILTASRGHLSKGWFDIALDQPEDNCLQFLRQLTTATAHSRWHYSRFLIVESAGCPAAALCAFRAADAYLASPLAIADAAQSVGLSPAEQARIWKRGAYLFTCSTRSADDNWVLESIATLPDHRQRGYTSMLLARAIEDGRARGLKEAEVTVVIGNLAAERMYVAAGFRCVSESLHADFKTATGAIGQRRLVKAL